MKIPGDALERVWLKADFPTDASVARQMERGLLTLLAPADDEIEVIGNAFIISAQQTSAICFTAAHNFERIKHLRSARQSRSVASLPPDFKSRVNYIQVDEATAFYLHDGAVLPCRIGQVAYHEGYDVAVFTVHAPEGQKVFERHLAIDLSFPEVGDEVLVFGHKLGVEQLGNNQGRVSRKLQLLRGVVSAITFEKGRMAQHCNFETTVPIEAGFSGSPILRYSGVTEGKMIACGVASFDFSDPAAFKSFLTPGLSTCATLWPTMGTALIKGSVFGDTEQFHSVNELRAAGAFDDQTPEHVRLAVEPSADGIDVRYTNTRTSTGYVYTVKPHPDAYSPPEPTKA